MQNKLIQAWDSRKPHRLPSTSSTWSAHVHIHIHIHIYAYIHSYVYFQCILCGLKQSYFISWFAENPDLNQGHYKKYKLLINKIQLLSIAISSPWIWPTCLWSSTSHPHVYTALSRICSLFACIAHDLYQGEDYTQLLSLFDIDTNNSITLMLL